MVAATVSGKAVATVAAVAVAATEDPGKRGVGRPYEELLCEVLCVCGFCVFREEVRRMQCGGPKLDT